MSALRQAIRAAFDGPPRRLEDGSWRQSCCFAADSVAFAGHFPGNPMLPGLAQLLAGALVAEIVAGQPLVLSGVKRARFQLPLLPGQVVDIVVRPPVEDGGLDWNVRLLSGSEQAASFQLSLDRSPAPGVQDSSLPDCP